MAILIENRQNAVKIDLRKIRSVLTRLLKHLGYAGYELSLVLVDNETIREINRTYLNRDRSTNVISFPMQEGEYGGINPKVLGDIVISVETARNDAEKEQIEPDDELDFLMIHGLLHLLGYDHENASVEETRRMQEKEAELFFFLKGYRLSEG